VPSGETKKSLSAQARPSWVTKARNSPEPMNFTGISPVINATASVVVAADAISWSMGFIRWTLCAESLSSARFISIYFQRGGGYADLLRKTRENEGDLDGVRMGKRGFLAVAFNGPQRQPYRMTVKEWEKAKALYVSGKGWKAIGEQLGLSVATLKTKASRCGLTQLRKETEAIISSDISVKTEKSLEALSALVRSKLAADAASTLERVNGYDLDGIKDEATRETILGSVAKRSALVFGWSETGESATSVSINLLGSMPDRISAEVVAVNLPTSEHNR